jgi:hypothetical protein
MATDTPDHEGLQLEIQRLELETKKLELEIKHEELRNQRQRRPRFVVSPMWIPLLAAGFALFGSLGTTFVTARDRAQAEAIEQRKFEMAVVQEAIKGNDLHKTAVRLLFAARAGYIHLDDEQEKKLVAFARGETAARPEDVLTVVEPKPARKHSNPASPANRP